MRKTSTEENKLEVDSESEEESKGTDDDDDDAQWYRSEVGEEPSDG